MANWVDKTSNLLADDLDAGAGDQVELALAERDPGHWVTLVWQLACWQVGAVVTLGRRSAAAAVVVGPDEPTAAMPGAPVLVCSLHPLGLPLIEPPPAGVLDYALECGRSPTSTPPPAVRTGPGLARPDPAADPADLVSEVATDRRRLISRATLDGQPRWPACAAAGRGSSVVVTGPARPEQLARIAGQEQADLPAGGDTAVPQADQEP